MFIFFNLMSNSQAQSLFGTTSYGISPDSVKALYPGYFKNTPSNKDSVITNLSLRDYEISGYKYIVSLDFLNNKLVKVKLWTPGNINLFEAQVRFDELTRLLKTKYGSEFSRKKDVRSYFYELKSVWNFNKTNIILEVYGQTNENAILTLEYSTEASAEADKL